MIREMYYTRKKLSYRVPHDLGRNEWEIKGKLCIEDKRVQELLTVSYGNLRDGNLRDISLTIGGKVIILDPLNQNALVKLLMDATRR